MKLLVIGCGQCGGRIADEFARLNRRARVRRGIEIISGAFAVNTDTTHLTELSFIKPDYQHRILIGARRTGGHGVGKINELAAEIAKNDGDNVAEAIRTARRFSETGAFLLIAGAAGGTGSGSIPIITRYIKERFGDKPVYNLIILPFEHEETTEERTIHNTATCLKSASLVADAVFLVDNQRYIRKDFSLRDNIAKINTLIVEPFYNLLCAGEEKKPKYIGAKMLDTGDIIQTLLGWTVIGYGKSPISRFSFRRISDLRNKADESHKGIQAIDEAISELSLKCNPGDSGRALYLLSAPASEMNVELVRQLGDYLKDIAPQAIIRNGDYPREKGLIGVTVILSELRDVEKVRTYYSKSAEHIGKAKKKPEVTGGKPGEIEDASKDMPSLF